MSGQTRPGIGWLRLSFSVLHILMACAGFFRPNMIVLVKGYANLAQVSSTVGWSWAMLGIGIGLMFRQRSSAVLIAWQFLSACLFARGLVLRCELGETGQLTLRGQRPTHARLGGEAADMTPPDSFRTLFLRSFIPSTSGGIFALYSAALSFLAVIVMYIHARLTNQPMPDHTDALLTDSVGMPAAHQVRGTLADKANAENGILPVPVEAPVPADEPANP